jgi:hypothetical protein
MKKTKTDILAETINSAQLQAYDLGYEMVRHLLAMARLAVEYAELENDQVKREPDLT